MHVASLDTCHYGAWQPLTCSQLSSHAIVFPSTGPLLSQTAACVCLGLLPLHGPRTVGGVTKVCVVGCVCRLRTGVAGTWPRVQHQSLMCVVEPLMQV